MRGVILAGGLGTRLYPLTKVTNKHLLPVGHEPMIFNPIKQLVSCGIKDILIVTSKEHMGDIVRLLGSGEELGCRFTFMVQSEPKGIADALSLAEDFVRGERIVVILGDNILTHSIKRYADSFCKGGSGAKILLKKVGKPEAYGVAALDERGMLVRIEEKPREPKSRYAVIGVYMYDQRVFDIIRRVRPSRRGELEITSVNNEYIKLGALEYEVVRGEWTDAGTLESLAYANEILMKNGNRLVTSK
jgi:glucose-1-phosphate thymidylyltransferase